MKELLTYTALKTTNLDQVLSECVAAAKERGLSFSIPRIPNLDVNSWVGSFESGWVFAQAEPGCRELNEVLASVAKKLQVPTLSGGAAEDYKIWSYEYRENEQVLHRFHADPASQCSPSEYSRYEGEPGAFEALFGISLFRARKMLRQFNADSVQEFLKQIGFENSKAQLIRFVVLEPLQPEANPSAEEATESRQKEPKAPEKEQLSTTSALDSINLAVAGGYSGAAAVRAEKFASKEEYNRVFELYENLLKEKNHKLALTVADKLLKRIENGEWDSLPPIERDNRRASIHGMRGLALAELGPPNAAIEELKNNALCFNRYLGPTFRALISATLGRLCVEYKRYDEALEPLRLRLAEEPLDAESWALYARAALESKRTNEARTALLRGHGIDPELFEWHELLARLEMRTNDLKPPRNPELVPKLRSEGEALIQAGKKLQAIGKFEEAYHNDPANADCSWGLVSIVAECYREGLLKDNTDEYEPIRLLEQVIFANPAWPWAWGTLLELLHNRSLYKRAQSAAEAYALAHVNRVGDMVDLCNWVLSFSPDLSIIMMSMLMGRLVDLHAQNEVTPEERDRDLFRSYVTLGVSYMNVHRFNEALPALNEAIQIDPRDGDCWHLLAQAHMAMGNPHGAHQAIHSGLYANPGHPGLVRLSHELRY